jgi:hypothetical protein
MRRAQAPLQLCMLYLCGDATSAVPQSIKSKLANTIGKFGAVSLCASPCQTRTLASGVDDEAAAVLVITEGHEPRDEAGLWDAMLLFELHPDIAAAGGRITDTAGKILACCTPAASERAAAVTWVGMQRTDPGAAALALKQQSAASIPADYFICRTEIFREAVAGLAELTQPASLSERICSVAKARGMRLAYSPLFEAVRSGPSKAPLSESSRSINHVGP